MTELTLIIDKLDALQGDMHSLQGDMRSLQGGMRSPEGDMRSLQTGMRSLEGEVHELTSRFDAQPDLRLLLHSVNQIRDQFITHDQELRMLRSAINDHARDNVTPGEIEAIHYDLQAKTRADLDVAIRLSRNEDALSLPPLPA